MATWIAVLPDGTIQDPNEIPLKNPDVGFAVGPKLWTLYNNDPIRFRINSSIGGQPFYCVLYICCASKTGSYQYTLSSEATLGLDPLNAQNRNIANDIFILSNQSSTTIDIGRAPYGVRPWIDAEGGTELILMADIVGYGPASSVTMYDERWFRFFTGDRLRSQVFFVDGTGSDWNSNAPSRDYHDVASNPSNAGCFRWAHRSTGYSNIYELRTESAWAGDYQDWLTLEIENVHIGDLPPPLPQSSSSGERLTISPLVHVRNCADLNLEMTNMIFVGGFPTFLLETSYGTKSNATLHNNIIIKDTLKGTVDSPEIPPSATYFWSSWVPFDNSTNVDDYPPIIF